ncbi:802_t:CDS:2 [Entrophospora sp. SA101]|nr:802_t:CDS:2 [Entrophospora sp. SA101]
MHQKVGSMASLEDKHGAKTVQVQTTGNDKNHFTCALTILADDTKLPPIVIFKEFTFSNHGTNAPKRVAWLDKILEVWDEIPKEMIVKLFKNCGISDNSVDELDELEKESVNNFAILTNKNVFT